MGAYLSTFAPCVPTYLYATLLSGTYQIPVIYAEVKAVFTSTVAVDAYRGAGRPEATYLLERLVDVGRGETGMDRVEIRRRNFIPTDAFPYQTPVALQYDSGDYFSTLDQALERAGWAASRRGGLKRRSRASCAASASPPTSRPAASRPPPWSARSAPAPGSTRSAPSASTRPAASPC
jgi:carbon-monoxide dehydrogenase large subunit